MFINLKAPHIYVNMLDAVDLEVCRYYNRRYQYGITAG